MTDAAEPENTLHTIEYDALIEVRSLAKREIDVRLVPWDVTAETVNGVESFTRGAFADAIAGDILLHGLEHEVHLGLGQAGQPQMTRHPVGRATELWDTEDGQYARFRVARTARGDEVLALAEERLVKGVSLEFSEVPGGTQYSKERGRRRVIHTRAHLSGASTTYRPTWPEAEVIAVRSKEGVSAVADAPVTEAQAAPPAVDMAAIQTTISAAMGSEVKVIGDRIDQAMTEVSARAASKEAVDALLGRIEAMEEQARASFSIPSKPADKAHPDDFGRGDWLKLVLKTLSGETVSQAELQARVAADLVTSDNLGVIPTAYLSEIIGIIDQTRPFLGSTRRINVPANGMTLSVPKIVTRPTTGVQANEKDELSSGATSIVPATFESVAVGGYGDISIQLLKRSDPSYLEMYTDLLAEAYAIDADDQAVDALLAETAVVEGGTVDPNDGLQFGTAWANAAAVSRRLVPDTLWLSTPAVAAFIDAKSDTTNAPLYANLAANFTAGGGVGGSVSGLRPVHVPALDDEAVDMIVGPSRAFIWTEDGTYTLQVDVPAKAGRDVGIIGMLWFAPLYPAAFTTYVLAS